MIDLRNKTKKQLTVEGWKLTDASNSKANVVREINSESDLYENIVHLDG